ncbi:MAG: T9SS type A sorting domain-containing protein, partial [Bacteroidota bacterium]
FSAVNFDGAGPGTCLVWYLRYDGEIIGLEAGLNANDLEGCFGLSNAVQVIRTVEGDCQANGGELFGGPFEFIVGDGLADMIPEGAITVANSQGENFQWIVTDDQGSILGLPPTFSAVDFDGAGLGVCQVWYLRYDGEITGLEAGLNIDDIEGCFGLSNPVDVNRIACEVEGGTLEGGPFEFCVGDGEADMIPEGSITLSGNSGSISAWIVTDDQGNILGLPPMPSVVDFDDAGPGLCLVWHISYEEGLQGLEVGANASDLVGCFDLSNSISVTRNQPEGGTLEGGPFTFIVGDGVADTIATGDITLSGNSGANSAWIVTDDQGNILGLPPMPSAVDFDGVDPGVCLIWHISFADGLVGLEQGANAADLEGCFDLSNSITVNREIVDATEEANPADVSVNIWPNPVQDMLQVRVEFEERPEFVQLEVRNQLGQVVTQLTLTNELQVRENVNVSQLPAGVYLISVRTESGISTQQLIKQ